MPFYEEEPTEENTAPDVPQAQPVAEPAEVPAAVLKSPSPHVGGSYRYNPVTDSRELVDFTDDPAQARPEPTV